MKKIGFIFLLLISAGANAQLINMEAFRSYEPNESWYIDGGAGSTIFLGDIAPIQKLTLKNHMNQYHLGYVLRMGKRIFPILDLNLECIKGKLGGEKEFDAVGSLMDLAFKGNYWGLTFNVRLDILKSFTYTRGLPASVFFRFGGGPLFYRSVKTYLSTGEYWSSMGMNDEGASKGKRVQTSVAPIGFGLFYEISDNFRTEIDIDLYHSSTDFLDSHHGMTSTCNDKFVMANLIIQYTFDFKDNSSKKNKVF